MFTESQAEGLLQKQKDFMLFPNVKPAIKVLYICRCCGKRQVRLQCCGSMWCPVCNLKLSLKISSQFIRFSILHKHLKKVFLTLTWKNIDKLEDDTFKNYRNDFTKKFLRNKIIKDKIYGGLYAFDYTINSVSGFYNFHLHCIVFLNEYIPQSVLSDVWLRITKDSYVVDIRKINDIKNGIAEVMKYIQSNKLLLVSDEYKRQKLIDCISSIRRFSKFGKLYKEKLEKGILKCGDCKSQMFDKIIYGENLYDIERGIEGEQLLDYDYQS